jgi:hypothetical protein
MSHNVSYYPKITTVKQYYMQHKLKNTNFKSGTINGGWSLRYIYNKTAG